MGRFFLDHASILPVIPTGLLVIPTHERSEAGGICLFLAGDARTRIPHGKARLQADPEADVSQRLLEDFETESNQPRVRFLAAS